MDSKTNAITALRAGIPAPEFTLRSTPDQFVSLTEFRGRPVVLAFYPADWSPVCGDQMSLYNELLPEFRSLGAELLGISVDGTWCHAAFSRERKFHFPLLADFEPKGAVARLYGVFRGFESLSLRQAISPAMAKSASARRFTLLKPLLHGVTQAGASRCRTSRNHRPLERRGERDAFACRR